MKADLPLFSGRYVPVSPGGVRTSRLALERALGEGALGATWRSRLPDGTPVAAKRLRDSRPEVRRRLEELQRLDLDPRSLLPLRAAFEDGRWLWAVFELDDGASLDRLLQRARLRPAQAVVVGRGILEALAALHAAGAWHGAVHARNVHVGEDGTVRLSDYGLATPGAEADARGEDVGATGALIAGALGWGSRLPRTSLGLALRAITGSRRLMPAGKEAAYASLTLWEALGERGAGAEESARRQLGAIVAELR